MLFDTEVNIAAVSFLFTDVGLCEPDILSRWGL
jgi:hypothetical protein